MTHRISQLIYRSLLGTITAEESEELQVWMAEHPDNARLAELLANPTVMDRDLGASAGIDCRRPADDMLQRIGNLRRARRTRRMAIAATIALVIASGIYFLTQRAVTTVNEPVAYAAADAPATLDDIRPGSARARLSSSAGPVIELSGSQSGTDATALSSGSDKSGSRAAGTVDYCLDVPRGGEFKIVLEDSTEVWLNSQSQLRYPEVFASNERRIQLTGEAYLHVAPDADRPFYVESRGQEVRVYGTTFNIKAYEDEEVIYTTLESGSISLRPLSGYGGEIVLSPGHQALFDCHNERVDMRVVKPSVITGWRNGRFVFEEQNLESIMRDLSRWYDFDYEFADAEARDIVFLGSIPRYSDFTTAIAILENSGGLKFTLNDKKVVISVINQ